jgi:hypothetical protein
MARPLRIESAHALYHVTSQANARQKVFRDDRDDQRSPDWLRRAKASPPASMNRGSPRACSEHGNCSCQHESRLQAAPTTPFRVVRVFGGQ